MRRSWPECWTRSSPGRAPWPPFADDRVKGLKPAAARPHGLTAGPGAPVPGPTPLIPVGRPSCPGLTAGTGLALTASLVRSRRLQQMLLTAPPLGIALPSFWVGLLLLQQFSFRRHLFPAFGNDGCAALVLPSLTLALPATALIAQLLSRSLQSELRRSYIDTARAKGVRRSAVHVRHALRNAVLPALTMAGLLVGGMLSGSVVVETVFSRDGVGRLIATAVSRQDLPLVQGLVLLGAAAFATVNLLVDLLYTVLDPRIGRTGGASPEAN
ncbi:ABC transporter permease [Streptomyces sp. P01-B04]|nr:ABC transporter permease [Streptomyces poriferorum]MBW5259612.1 ABC transporter permease [Streptomyces poriferorum]